MRLQEDKTRFINNLPWETEEEKQKVLDFFKVHANLESKIQNWQSRDKEGLVNEIRNLISEVEKASLEKEKAKEGYKGNIDWEAHDCRYLGEDKNWIYITPLSWEGGKFCDSAECGGAGAKWCIGYEKSSEYWKGYRQKKTLFLMKVNKYPKNKQEDLKFMIQGYLGKDVVDIWDQTDHKEEYTLSEIEKEYLRTIQKIWDEVIAKYFDNPERGVYIAKNEEAVKHFGDVKEYLKVFKVKDGVTFKNIEDAHSMFSRCPLLTSVDTSVFVNVENASFMFQGCESLTSIDTSVFKNVRGAEHMFQGCKSLTSINTSGLVNVKDATCLFSGCLSLTSVDASGFKNVKNAPSMFASCKSLKSIDTSGFKNVKNASYMFWGCNSLTSIDTSGFANVEVAEYMFAGCKSLTSIDTSAFVNVKYTCGMFDNCPSLKTYIPGPNKLVNEELEKIGARPVKRLGESFRRRIVEEILEE